MTREGDAATSGETKPPPTLDEFMEAHKDAPFPNSLKRVAWLIDKPVEDVAKVWGRMRKGADGDE